MTERPGVERIARVLGDAPYSILVIGSETSAAKEAAAALYDAGLRVVDSPEPEKADEAPNPVVVAWLQAGRDHAGKAHADWHRAHPGKGCEDALGLPPPFRAATPAPPEPAYTFDSSCPHCRDGTPHHAAPSGPALDVPVLDRVFAEFVERGWALLPDGHGPATLRDVFIEAYARLREGSAET